MSTHLSTKRRDFIKTTAAIASVSILPAHILRGANVPSEQFRFAQVGLGGKGFSDRAAMLNAGAKLVAMCDVDKEKAQKALDLHTGLPLYDDYRVLLDKHDKEIDGVVVSTPDHTHACIALEAIRRGKHVYVQKPLARTYQECQALQDASKKHGVVTQMGNQGHSGDGLKLWQQMQDQNEFGDIEHIHTWSDRPGWPQGMQTLPPSEPVRSSLAWDLWLGPAANRAYSSKYLPFSWRGWWDFGCGAMGDMAVHNMDPAFWIFKLGLPNRVKATPSDKVDLAYPTSSVIELSFDKSPVTGKPINITWYDGKERPVMPAGAHPELTSGSNGCMVVGSKMTAMGGSHAGRPLPIAIGKQAYGPEVKELERQWREIAKGHKGDDHYGQWVNAAKSGDVNATGSKFDYSVPFTQSILLACIALRFPGQELHWDDNKKAFSNNSEANQWLSFQPRKGFNLSV